MSMIIVCKPTLYKYIFHRTQTRFLHKIIIIYYMNDIYVLMLLLVYWE